MWWSYSRYTHTFYRVPHCPFRSFSVYRSPSGSCQDARQASLVSSKTPTFVPSFLLFLPSFLPSHSFQFLIYCSCLDDYSVLSLHPTKSFHCHKRLWHTKPLSCCKVMAGHTLHQCSGARPGKTPSSRRSCLNWAHCQYLAHSVEHSLYWAHFVKHAVCIGHSLYWTHCIEHSVYIKHTVCIEHVVCTENSLLS